MAQTKAADDYQPGDMCIATVRGVKGVRVMRMDEYWVSGAVAERTYYHTDEVVTDIRRLIVLDLDESQLSKLRDPVYRWGLPIRGLFAQIEAQTKPPRIPEPSLYGPEETA